MAGLHVKPLDRLIAAARVLREEKAALLALGHGMHAGIRKAEERCAAARGALSAAACAPELDEAVLGCPCCRRNGQGCHDCTLCGDEPCQFRGEP